MTIMKKRIILAIALFSALFLFFYFFGSDKNKSEEKAYSISTEKIIPEIRVAPFDNINLEAKSAYVFDVISKKPIFELNAGSQLPLASLTKLMTAAVAKENIPEWTLVDISPAAIMAAGDYGFLAGEKWKISDLLDAMLISSSNDAAAAIALSRNDFVFLMNKKSDELKLRQTYFLNSTGLDSNNQIAGAYGSARDVANLLNYLIKSHPSLLEATQYGEIQINSRSFKNTNKLIDEMPGIIAGKTGYSDLAGGNLAVVFDIGLEHPVIIVALGSSEEGRFEDVKKLYNETLKYFSSQ